MVAPKTKQQRNANSKKSNVTAMQYQTPWKALKARDLDGLSEKIIAKFQWTSSTPKEFQITAIVAQLKREDVLIHAGTGAGKTVIAAGPHAHEKMAGKVTIVVSPLIVLQEEQVQTFENEFKLRAMAINSKRSGGIGEIMTRVCNGEWQIVIMSPEMLLSKKFVDGVLKKREFASRLLSVVVDEAHVVSHWGANFRKNYGRLGILRALLPKGTPIVAMSATLPPRIREDVLKKLQFPAKFITVNLGNDRPNVSIVVRPIHHAMNTYKDLDFIIPEKVQNPSDIPKTMLYADQIAAGVDIEDRLYEQCPDSFRDPGVIRPYSAGFSQEYRERVMKLFLLGVVRVLICTDAAGMGCNILDIDRVVQWKLPSTVSTFVQRAGRAARGAGRTGLAILLVERSVYEADLEKLAQATAGKSKGVRQSAKYVKATKAYAVDRGVNRGSFDGANDETWVQTPVTLDRNAADEGLYSLAQSGTCRRMVLTEIYGNAIPKPSVPCCDVCRPSLLDLTRAPPPEPGQRNAAVKRGIADVNVVKALHEWRKEIRKRDFSHACFGLSPILSNDHLELLSSVGPIGSEETLKCVLGGKWAWYNEYGAELLTRLKELKIPAMKPKPRAKKVPAKRPLEDEAVDVTIVSETGSSSKRVKQTTPMSHTPATPTQLQSQPAQSRVMPLAITPLPMPLHYPSTPVMYYPQHWPYHPSQPSSYPLPFTLPNSSQTQTSSNTQPQPSQMKFVMYQPPGSTKSG